MLFLIGSGLGLVLVIFALADVIAGDGSHIKNLDKLTWVFVIILLPVIGSILWFIVGREWGGASRHDLGSFGSPQRAQAAGFTELSTTERELAALEAEIAFHEKQDRVRKLEAELEAKRSRKDV
jgi:hypothetical protein